MENSTAPAPAEEPTVTIPRSAALGLAEVLGGYRQDHLRRVQELDHYLAGLAGAIADSQK